MAASASRYRAYISYSHADRAWADWLHKALETYRVPSRLVGTQTAAGVIPRRLIPVFRDRVELASAADLTARINEAMQRSDNMEQVRRMRRMAAITAAAVIVMAVTTMLAIGALIERHAAVIAQALWGGRCED